MLKRAVTTQLYNRAPRAKKQNRKKKKMKEAGRE
jgi:hypothetical protein